MSGRGSYPWKFREQSPAINGWYLLDGDDYPITTKEQGRRIVECVNACAGVTFQGDPEGAVRELLEAADAFYDLWANGMYEEQGEAQFRLDAAITRFHLEDES